MSLATLQKIERIVRETRYGQTTWRAALNRSTASTIALIVALRSKACRPS
jgi:hypothetical protein